METVAKNIPFEQFERWFKKADASEPEFANAMTLATATPTGAPSLRMVLMKGWDETGFVFYTNTKSRKGAELKKNDQAALLFHWKSQKRQIRIEGLITPVSQKEADQYFATRPRGAQIGAWASDQSRVMSGRHQLKKRVAQTAAKYLGRKIPRPPYWSGYRLAPEVFEFWANRRFRLHERELYTLQKDGSWKKELLFP